VRCGTGFVRSLSAIGGETEPVDPQMRRLEDCANAIWDIDDSLADSDPDPQNPAAMVATVREPTWRAIAVHQDAGGRDAIATGRRASDLVAFPDRRPDEASRPVIPPQRLRRFDFAVTEMGGVILYPRTGAIDFAYPDAATGVTTYGPVNRSPLASAGTGAVWKQALVDEGVPADQIWVGRTVVSSKSDHREAVIRALRRIEIAPGVSAASAYSVVLNGTALNVVPNGIDKAVGVRHAAQRAGYDLQRTAGIGNSMDSDWPFMETTAFPVAVANADDRLKAAVGTHIRRTGRGAVTAGERGSGAVEVLRAQTAGLRRGDVGRTAIA
jgi:hydroxymethylpyrimidine pyrophosphatase-like HAD family hydrolase